MFVDTPLRSYKGYCRHGAYVGGIGIDWMCGYCESGITELWKCDCGKSEWFDTRNPVKCIANPERADRARSIMRMRSDLRKMVDEMVSAGCFVNKNSAINHTNEVIRKDQTSWSDMAVNLLIEKRLHIQSD